MKTEEEIRSLIDKVVKRIAAAQLREAASEENFIETIISREEILANQIVVLVLKWVLDE